ncbi:hypothetical protein [Dietzia sp. ANT_WB102]|uniref:hypothetical protein n=1 Tax=Dietzia sp. ANT_WB102 TaxID=2597345 RepID=UPI0011EF435E|nr:hypothetical protein [Dietzia sp. ANT_WB102]KAA0917006.1 hypothetical protein FQ137_12240 [Dietzia sp. ANT_WB102]
MARMKNLAIAADDAVEDFLTGDFLRTMRLYGQMAETPNPATVAADALQHGEAATVPGEWLGPDFYGVTVRLKAGKAPEVVQ